MLERMTGNVVISEVDARLCRTKHGRKLRTLWGIFGTADGMSKKPRS